MKKLIPILDNGHGGLINGVYQTPGKRSPNLGNGVLYEGDFNRIMVNRVCEYLSSANIPFYKLVPEDQDRALSTRVNRANEIFKANPNTYGISIHANAGGGTGYEGFTGRGETKSDIIATKFLRKLESDFPETKMRFDFLDGDPDKEKDYQILKYTRCPFVLLELGFMDFKADYDNLWNMDWRNKMTKCLAESIVDIFNNGI